MISSSATSLPLSRLPVPDIRDEVAFQHSNKQRHRRPDQRIRPPKLKPINRSISSTSMSNTAHAISFRGDGDSSSNQLSELDMQSLSCLYDRSINETYFEQCFTRLAKIGEGSFGEVFKVRSNEDGRLYAVKMSKELFRSEHYRQERLEEVRRYEQFSGHANFVQFYRAWEQNDRLYMQMELCRESLDRYLERRRQIPEEKIWKILLDLLLALKNLHDRNLIHLDIKLDNVLVGDDDSCKLADFGLVIDVDRANRHQATEGDSRYIAPEILQGKFSKAADIFSLGVAMLELSCFLELPYNGPLWQQLRSGVLPQDFLKMISPELQVIIRQMMAPDPVARPTVDMLLNHKKLISLLEQRNRWHLVKKVQQTIRRSRRVAWSKLCNFKNVVFSFLTSMITNYLFRDPIREEHKSNTQHPMAKQMNGKWTVVQTRIIASTPTIKETNTRLTPNEFLLNDNCLDISEQSTPITFATSNKIVNSTPVNHNQSFRSRKDLTKTSFRAVESCAIENVNGNQTSSVVISQLNSFSSLDDMDENLQSLVPLDKSMLRRKKLFTKPDNLN